MSSIPQDVVAQWSWPGGTHFRPTSDGLINQTWLAQCDGQLVGVVQQLNTQVFVPEVHYDIEAVTRHVAAAGEPTPQLVPTRDGALWATVASGVFRRLTPIGTRTMHRLSSAEQAMSAGAIVGRFHNALAGLDIAFRSVRAGAHDTDEHMARLSAAVAAHPEHRLHGVVAPLAARILHTWQTWDGTVDGPERIIHGDLKVSNLRWDGDDAVAVIDLDTMQRGTLAVELGDAFRSWCTTGSEDTDDSTFDVDCFAHAMRGYLSEITPSPVEMSAIVPGIERIATELAARFARDALEESYFGFNPKYGTRGEHNLRRARNQLSLAQSVRSQRHEIDAALTRSGLVLR